MMDKNGKPRSVKPKNTLAVAVILAIAFLAWYFIGGFLGSGNYPLRFRRNLNAILGAGNWDVVHTESKKSTLVRKEKTTRMDSSMLYKTGSFKTWIVEFTGKDGEIRELELSNLSHKSENRSKNPFSENYLSNRACFGMNILGLAENLAADDVEKNVFPKIFDLEDYQHRSPNIGEKGVGIDIGFRMAERFGHDYYQGITEPGTCFDLTDFYAAELLETGNYCLYIDISTYKAGDGVREEMDKKAQALKNSLLAYFGEEAAYNISVSHHSAGQDYHSNRTEDADKVQFYFGYRGNEVSAEEVREAMERAGLGTGTPDIQYYMKAG